MSDLEASESLADYGDTVSTSEADGLIDEHESIHDT